MLCLLAETCMNKYVQTLNQQKITNTTREKRGGMKGKEIHHSALAHIMHAPHKAYNFRFKSKEREEKSKRRYAESKEKGAA